MFGACEVKFYKLSLFLIYKLSTCPCNCLVHFLLFCCTWTKSCLGSFLLQASIVPQKKEVFERMLELGVGRSCALLFTSWSEYLEAIGDTKCAVEVLQRGLYLNAQPVSTLETALRWITFPNSVHISGFFSLNFVYSLSLCKLPAFRNKLGCRKKF